MAYRNTHKRNKRHSHTTNAYIILIYSRLCGRMHMGYTQKRSSTRSTKNTICINAGATIAKSRYAGWHTFPD